MMGARRNEPGSIDLAAQGFVGQVGTIGMQAAVVRSHDLGLPSSSSAAATSFR